MACLSCGNSAPQSRALQARRQALVDPLADLRQRMQRTGQWGDHQIAGRRWPVGCVSLEITQRCNLDCSLCYLSESAEAVQDFPLEEIFRRIDLILQHYGPGTDVQVSGGEPSLRPREELVAIVRRLAQRGLRPSLFTNGIKASRELLTELAQAGLVDVAFHVDSTQQRAGYDTESSLNSLRDEYIGRARGLPLSVFLIPRCTAETSTRLRCWPRSLLPGQTWSAWHRFSCKRTQVGACSVRGQVASITQASRRGCGRALPSRLPSTCWPRVTGPVISWE